jgi:hypothetical protein
MALGLYTFTLPAALQYRSLRLDAHGNTFYGPSRVRGLLDAGSGEFEVTDGIKVSSHSTSWYTVGTVDVTGRTAPDRTVFAGVIVTTETGRVSDFDINQVRLVVSYYVLD